MKMRTKLVLMFFLCIGSVSSSLMFMSYRQMNVSKDAIEKMNQGFAQVRLIQEMQNAFKTQVQEWKNVLLRGAEPEQRQKYFEGFVKESASIHTAAEKLAPDLGADNAKLLAEFTTAEDALTLKYTEVKKQTLDGEVFDAKAADKAVKGLDRKVLEPLEKLTAALSLAAQESSRQASEKIAGYFNFSLILTAVFFAIAILVSWQFALRLARTLTEVNRGLSDSGGEVATASEQMSTASQQLAEGSTQAAASLEETVASIEEVSSMIQLNANNARESGALSQKSREAAKRGETEIGRLITEMAQIRDGAKRIEEITRVIDDIAFQTNLLALNASVESARAGELGKGFGVVADAVRALALRSATAAKDISLLIKENVEKAASGAKIADASSVALQEIVMTVNKVADLNSEIASASQEQSNGIAQISKAMNQLDQATQGNAAAAEETAASSTEMASQAQMLKSYVNSLTVILEGKSA
jgi:methyl-accepting chemotaxis protein